MIDFDIPIGWIWLLRWVLFLGPLLATMVLGWLNRANRAALVGSFFAFLYGVGTIFMTHQIAIYFGAWSYGGETLMLMGFPVDIWLGGALLFGPVLYLMFPKTAPIYLTLPIIIGLHGLVFSSLEPLVFAGKGWFAGVIFVFAIAHIPALYLARWTREDRLLPLRAALLAFGFGFLAFVVLPSVVMTAMGGSWNLSDIPIWKLAAGLPVLGVCFLLGVTAVQMFVVHGDGTPIPLDNTKRLVRTGIYAYLVNPMQLCSAAAWIVIGFIIGNIWVASAALMAWVFVVGMVRWHHRHDLLVRFPDGWPTYRANVSEWRPRWRPWIAAPARLTYDPGRTNHQKLVTFLTSQNARGLDFIAEDNAKLSYREPDEHQSFTGLSAAAKAFNHINFFWCLVGAGLLMLTLPLGYMRHIKTHLREGGHVETTR